MKQPGNTLVGCSGFPRHYNPIGRRFLRRAVSAERSQSQSVAESRSEASSPRRQSGKPSVIILWMRGGPANRTVATPSGMHGRVRGEFRTMPTTVQGITTVGTAADVVRRGWTKVGSHPSIHHTTQATPRRQICVTFYNSRSNPYEEIYPIFGLSFSNQLVHLYFSFLPLSIPRPVPGPAGLLRRLAHKAFETRCRPGRPGPFRVPNVSCSRAFAIERVGDRRELLSAR